LTTEVQPERISNEVDESEVKNNNRKRNRQQSKKVNEPWNVIIIFYKFA